MHVGLAVYTRVLEICEPCYEFGKESERKILLSHLSAILLVEIRQREDFLFTFFGSFTAQD